MTEPVPMKLSRTLFFLTIYSIVEAALMGSSIGLVILQSRRFSSLVQDQHHNQHNHDQGFASLNDQHHRSSLLSYLFTAVFPLLGGYGTAMFSSSFILYREWIPKLFSPRTAILLSQTMFLVYWTILAAIQQVHKKLLDQSNNSPPSLSSPSIEQKPTMIAPIAPLSVVWFVAVILLGLTIGLFTAGASTMEWYIEDAVKEVESLEIEFEKDEKKERDENMTSESHDSHNNNESETIMERFNVMFSTSQKVVLLSLIIVLFLTELGLYKWIVSTQESETVVLGGTVAISTRLMGFSLVSGLIMLVVGLRYLPRTNFIEI